MRDLGEPQRRNQSAAPCTNPSKGTKPPSPIHPRRHDSSVSMYAAGSPVTAPAITCHEKPTATARTPSATMCTTCTVGSGSSRRRTHRTTP
jgi:hypothetical protein